MSRRARRSRKGATPRPPYPAADYGTSGVYESIDVRVPDIGDFKDIPIIEVFVKAGDTLKAEDPLISLESDKATMDVPSPASGTVTDLKVKVGDKVSEGSLILTLSTGVKGAASAAPPAHGAAPPAAALRRRNRLRGTRVAWTSNAKCWCWARGPAATPPRSGPPTSA